MLKLGRKSNPRPKAPNEEKPSYFSGWLLNVKICYVEFAQNRNVFGTPQKLFPVPNLSHSGGPIRAMPASGWAAAEAPFVWGCVSSRLVKWRT